jgi:capsid portal protein
MEIRIIGDNSIKKALTSTELNSGQAANADEWLTPPVNLRGLRELKKHSSILPQCIRAYKNNIAGFGISVKYRDDIKETPEMATEFIRASELIELLNTEQDTKEVFEDIIEAREIYGIAYLEVIRNLADEVVQIEFINDTPTITKTYPLPPYIETDFFYKGRMEKRQNKWLFIRMCGRKIA